MSPPSEAGYLSQIGAGIASALADAPDATNAPPPQETSPEETAPEETTAETTAEETPVEASAEETPPEPSLEEPAPEEAVPSPTDAQSYIAAISRPESEGGIGHVPTVEEIVSYRQAYVDQELFTSDIEAGDPQGRLINAILDSPNAARTLSKIPAIVSRQNPQLLRTFSRPILSEIVNGLREQAERAPAGDPNSEARRLKDSLYAAAQHLHHELHGKYYDPAVKAETSPEMSERERALAARERALADRMRQEISRTETHWINGVKSMNLTSLDAEIDKALAPAKGLAPLVYQGLKQQYLAHIQSRMQANKDAWTLYINSVARARRSNDPAQVESLREHYLRLARPEISATRSEFLKNAGVTIKANSNARHTQLQTSAAQKSPNGAPAPVKKSVQPAAPRSPMTDDQYRDRISSELSKAFS